MHVADRQSKSVAEVCHLFVAQAEAKVRDGRLGQSRLKSLTLAVEKSIVPAVGAKKIKELSVSDVEALFAKMQEGGRMSPRTARERVYVLKQVEDFAIKRQWLRAGVAAVASTDMRGLAKPKIKRFTIEQFGQLFRALDTTKRGGHARMYAMRSLVVNLAAFIGMRKGEVFGLTLDDIDLAEREIHIRHNLTAWDMLKSPKTARGLRSEILPAHIADMLAVYTRDFYIPNDRKLIFRGNCGTGFITTPNWHNIQWRPLLKAAGLWQADGDQFHFHALRHFQASWKAYKGMPVAEITESLGHATFDTTLGTYIGTLAGLPEKRDRRDALSSELLRRASVATIDSLAPGRRAT